MYNLTPSSPVTVKAYGALLNINCPVQRTEKLSWGICGAGEVKAQLKLMAESVRVNAGEPDRERLEKYSPVNVD
jgi:hypothetical protein